MQDIWKKDFLRHYIWYQRVLQTNLQTFDKFFEQFRQFEKIGIKSRPKKGLPIDIPSFTAGAY